MAKYKYFILVHVILSLLDFYKIESAKALIRVDSWKVKGSKYVKAKISYENFANGSFAANLSYFDRQSIKSEMHLYKLRACQGELDTNYSLVVWETKMDFCRMLQGVRSSILAKVIYENFFKTIDGEIECPIQAGYHNFTNQLYTNKYLPPFPSFLYPSGIGKFLFKSTVKGILMGQKKYVNLYDYELYGTGFNADMFNTSLEI